VSKVGGQGRTKPEAASNNQPKPKADHPVVAVTAGAFAAASLLMIGALGLTTVVAALGGVVVLISCGLLGVRWRALANARADGIEHDIEKTWPLWLMLALLAAVAAAPAVLLREVGWEHSLAFDTNDRLWPWRGMALCVAVMLLAIQVSALIDWAYIRPHLRGLRGSRALPCQRHSKPNWSWLTRLWLAHRFAASMTVRAGAIGILGFCALLLVPAHDGDGTGRATEVFSRPMSTVIGAVAAAALVFALNRLMPVVMLVRNPRISVGDRVVFAEEYGTGVNTRPAYYVVDVAVEGVKLLELDGVGQPKGAAGRPPLREHDRSLPLGDVPRLLRFRGRFNGCRIVCCGVNHDCPVRFGNPVRPENTQPAANDHDVAAG
jgi:hypothetical protein